MIVSDIDEGGRKVRFVDAPIEPRDFGYHYGKDRMNKYTKHEIKDRLEKSLTEKGMSLA
jgi:hypothetical protein